MLGIDWSIFPVEVTVDQVGRILVPKALREQALVPGSVVDISLYGDGLHVSPGGRTARLERRDGKLVAVADTVVTDDDVVLLVDSIRR